MKPRRQFPLNAPLEVVAFAASNRVALGEKIDRLSAPHQPWARHRP